MNDDSPSSAAEAVTADAAAWFSRIDSGTADLAAFERWRAADPRRAVAYARVTAVWRDLEGRDLRAEAGAGPAVADRPRERHPLPTRGAPSLNRRGALRVLASGAALLGAGGLAMQRAFARESAETGIGERRQVELPGGGMLALNTDSRISWRYGEDWASFWLHRGEVALALSSAAPPRLDLYSGGGADRIRLAPGRYNARIVGGMLQIGVLSGRVALPGARLADSNLVGARHRILLDSQVQVQSLDAQDLAALEAWPKGEILFHDEPLASAVQEYNRYLRRKIVIADPAIARIRVGGRFATSRPEPFLEALEAAFPLRVVQGDEAIVLTALD